MDKTTVFDYYYGDASSQFFLSDSPPARRGRPVQKPIHRCQATGELDTGKKSIGLIERVKQGQGRPAKTHAKRFITRAIPPQTKEPQPVPRLPIIGRKLY